MLFLGRPAIVRLRYSVVYHRTGKLEVPRFGGRLSVDAPAPVPEWNKPDDPRHAITLADLLQQCSGLRFEENYAHSSGNSNILSLIIPQTVGEENYPAFPYEQLFYKLGSG